jgi:hypothetical protein
LAEGVSEAFGDLRPLSPLVARLLFRIRLVVVAINRLVDEEGGGGGGGGFCGGVLQLTMQTMRLENTTMRAVCN